MRRDEELKIKERRAKKCPSLKSDWVNGEGKVKREVDNTVPRVI